MDILSALGVNLTIFVQFGIFLILLSFLYKGVFQPYYQCYLKRQAVTKLEDADFADLMDQTETLKKNYKERAQKLYQSCQDIYLKKEKQAFEEKERQIKQALEEAKKQEEEALQFLQDRRQTILSELSAQAISLSKNILKKLLPFEEEEESTQKQKYPV